MAKKKFDEFGNPIEEPVEPEPMKEDANIDEKLRYIEKVLKTKVHHTEMEETQQMILKQQGMIDELRKEVENLVESTTASFASIRNMQEVVESTKIEASDKLIEDLNTLAQKAGEQKVIISNALEESEKRIKEAVRKELAEGIGDAYRYSTDTAYMLRRDFMSLLPVIEGTVLQVERLISRARK